MIERNVTRVTSPAGHSEPGYSVMAGHSEPGYLGRLAKADPWISGGADAEMVSERQLRHIVDIRTLKDAASSRDSGGL